MAAELIAGDFNYASVDAETAAKLEYFAKSGKALIRKSQIHFVADMGKILSEAREVLASKGDGTFIKWAKAEFDVSHQTIWNYVNAWDKCLSNGLTNYLNWTQTALYLASSDEIPSPVFKKLERLPSTGTIRSCDIKRVIEAGKPKPKPVEEPEDEDEAETDDSETPDGDDPYAEPNNDGLPIETDDVEEFPEDETMEQICQRETSEIESWARKFGDMLKEAQKALSAVPTLDELNARDGWERKMRESLATLRGTKPVVCPICQGDGTAKCPCGGHGRVTKQQHGQMV